MTTTTDSKSPLITTAGGKRFIYLQERFVMPFLLNSDGDCSEEERYALYRLHRKVTDDLGGGGYWSINSRDMVPSLDPLYKTGVECAISGLQDGLVQVFFHQ